MLDDARSQQTSLGAVARAYVVDHGLVTEMQKRCRAQTPSSLNDQFGISWNTWSKLRKGQPIRRSVAIRLVSRVLATDGREADPMRYLIDGASQA